MAREQSPAFQFYPRDFLVDTEGMDPAAAHAYWVLCAHSWFPRPDNDGFTPPVGYLSPNDDFLAKQSRLTPAEWRKHRPAILARFKRDESDGPGKGLLYHKRIVEEWTKQQERSAQAREAGKASGTARKRKTNGSDNRHATEEATEGERTFNWSSTDAATEHTTNREPKTNPSSSSASATASEKKRQKKLSPAAAGGELDFEAVYAMYPRKDGKSEGLEQCRSQIKTTAAYADLRRAVEAFAAKMQREGREPKYVKQFDTFMRKGRWRQYLEPDAPDIGAQDPDLDGSFADEYGERLCEWQLAKHAHEDDPAKYPDPGPRPAEPGITARAP